MPGEFASRNPPAIAADVNKKIFLRTVQGGPDYAHSSGFHAGTWLSDVSWFTDQNAGVKNGPVPLVSPGSVSRPVGRHRSLVARTTWKHDIRWLRHQLPSESRHPGGNGDEHDTRRWDMAIDPVCKMNVRPDKAPAKAEYDGRMYYFCSRACHRAFIAEPQKYVGSAPHGGMHRDGHQ